MKKKPVLCVIFALMIAVSVIGLAACGDGESGNVQPDFRNPQIVEVYNLYVENATANGETPKTYEEWLANIKGEKGDKGDPGAQGAKGDKGDPGEKGAKGNGIKSVEKTSTKGLVDTYTITFDDGSTATFTVTNGADGKSAYQIWLNNGNEGTEEDFLEWLKGEDENPQGLDFYPLPNGTYAVECGKAKYLENIIIPQTYKGKAVTSIGEKAFYECTSLTSVTIPDSVTSIWNWAFFNCSSLTKVNYTGTIDSWCEISFGASTANPIRYAENLYINDQLVTEANITTATKINAYAFDKCTSLTSVTIGNSVTSIDNNAFYNCSSLTSINVDSNNANYKSIDGNLYSKDGTILIQYAPGKTATNFTIPNSVTSIGRYAFYYCTLLTSITIPNSVTSIGYCVFSGCDSLTSITIGNSVTSIVGSAFLDCSKLTSVYYTGSAAEWGNITIGSSNDCLTNATRYYYSATAPTKTGNFWRYVGGVPTVW